MKRLFCILLLLALSLSACTEAGEDGSSGGSSGGSSSTAAGTASDIAKDASELFTDRDYNDDYAEDGSVHALKLRDRFRVLHDDDLYRLSAHAGGRPDARARDGAELLGQDLSFFIAAAASARFDCL